MNGELSPDELRAAAYHEAGHALASLELGVRFTSVLISADDPKFGGRVNYPPNHVSPGEASGFVHKVHHIVIDLAGPIAQGRSIRGTPFVTLGAGVGWNDDRTQALLLSQRIVNDFKLARSSGGSVSSSGTSPEAMEIAEVLYLAAAAVVEMRWPEIEAVARCLLERRELTECEVKTLCASTRTAQREGTAETKGGLTC